MDAAFCTGCGIAREEATRAHSTTEDRRRVSVLFVDQVDSTRYAELTDPELIRQLQSDFYQTARQVVQEHGGVVEKYIGDAVMALFGAPVATEADTLRCVRAGLELQRLLPELAAGHDGALRYRVGVATGEALVDVAAAHDGGQAIVSGDVVNVAARIQHIAPPGGVLVCGATRSQTATTIRYEPHPSAQLRGRSAPTELWLAVAPIARADDGSDTTPLLEREHELNLLAGALHRSVRDRTSQLVTVFGQAGIGKSRLVRELHRRADQLAGTPVAWRVGYCPAFGQNVTYAGLADVVKAQAGILDSDPPETARARLERAARLVAERTEAHRLVQALGPLVGVPGENLPADEAEPAWRRFLVRLAGRGPTMLVFEDLHWADEPMRRFIELLVAAARDVPLVVLGTARPQLVDRDPSWARSITGSLSITLPPLRRDGIAALCGYLLNDRLITSEALSPLVELCDGIPLYAQEYARMLVERDAAASCLLSGDAGKGLGGSTLPMPDGVHGVIANRVDLLDRDDRAVLQAAAVVGEQFWPGAVAAALGRGAGSVERALRRLEQREFVAEQLESTMAGQAEFRFLHVLVRDVCYQRLPRTERVARHERVADWLESAWQRRETELAEVLAHHRWTAHEIARSLRMPLDRHAPAARRALRQAAEHAYSLHALDAAAGHLARALSLPAGATGAGEPGPAAEVEQLSLQLFATEVDFYKDPAAFQAAAGADRLRGLAEQLKGYVVAGAPGQPAAAAARAWTLLGQEARLRADRTTAVRHLRHAMSLFKPLPDSRQKVDALAGLARLHMLSYECREAIAAAEGAAAIASRLGLADASANARVTMATARYELGDPGGLAALLQVTEECRGQQLPALRRATRNLSHLVREEGDWHRSWRLYEEATRMEGAAGQEPLTASGSLMHAYFTGNLAHLAKSSGAATADQWDDMDDVGACVATLRLDPGAEQAIQTMLAMSRRTGLRRSLWAALAAAALCEAVLTHRGQAAGLLDELIRDWRSAAVLASGKWVSKAAVAAALTGPEPAEALREALSAGYRTPWCEAALHTVTAALSLTAGDAVAAGEQHQAAAALLGEIPVVTERMMALALAVAAFRRAGETARAAPALTEVREFAEQARLPGLLRIAEAGDGRQPGAGDH